MMFGLLLRLRRSRDGMMGRREKKLVRMEGNVVLRLRRLRDVDRLPRNKRFGNRDYRRRCCCPVTSSPVKRNDSSIRLNMSFVQSQRNRLPSQSSTSPPSTNLPTNTSKIRSQK